MKRKLENEGVNQEEGQELKIILEQIQKEAQYVQNKENLKENVKEMQSNKAKMTTNEEAKSKRSFKERTPKYSA